MKTAIRILITFITVVASYFFIYWVPFSLIASARKIPFLPNVISLLAALLIGFFVWRTTKSISMAMRLFSCVMLGGIILGTIGFSIGFFGPLIFTPSSNQGPLLGILITGPLGFLFGLAAGAGYWLLNVKDK